jgi:hypothetical protein
MNIAIFILQLVVTALIVWYSISMWQSVRFGRKLSRESVNLKHPAGRTLSAKEWWVASSCWSLSYLVVGAIALTELRRYQGQLELDWFFWYIHEPFSLATLFLTIRIYFWKSGLKDRINHARNAYLLAVCAAGMVVSGACLTWQPS